MLTDEALIKIKAGDGGDGLVSFLHEKYRPKGGPDGGDGGRGGDIFLEVTPAVHTLSEFSRRKAFAAPRGENGRNRKRTGADGDDLILRVPPGTIAKVENGPMFDFVKTGEKVLIAHGGRGGWGNVHFKSATRQSPFFARKGEPGEARVLSLELKLLANVGLIGLPNCGKSTLLAYISNARPKIAAYPFTTLEPNLGVAKIGSNEIIVADIPGLIEGAAKGKGLGDKFLRHIERTKILVHLTDINSDDLATDYNIIRGELQAWNPKLLRKKEIVVLNKADTMRPKEAQKIAAALSKKLKKDVLTISAVSGTGIKELLGKLV